MAQAAYFALDSGGSILEEDLRSRCSCYAKLINQFTYVVWCVMYIKMRPQWGMGEAGPELQGRCTGGPPVQVGRQLGWPKHKSL